MYRYLKKVLYLNLFIAGILYSQEFNVSMQEAIDIALQNNKTLAISKNKVLIAKSLYKQALSADYPRIDFNMNATRLDEPVTMDVDMFIEFPKDLSQRLAYIDALVKDQIGIIPPTPFPSNTAAMKQVVDAGKVPSSKMKVNTKMRVVGRDSLSSSLNVTYPLYTGGKVAALQNQASLGSKIAMAENKRATSDVIYDVKKYYNSALFLRKIKRIAYLTKKSLEFTVNLTEDLYKIGSPKVFKTDYLKSKITLSMLKGFYEDIILDEQLVLAALVNTMGLSYNDTVVLSQEGFEKPKLDLEMEKLLKEAYRFNPNMEKLVLAIELQNDKYNEVKSNYLPHIALFGNLKNIQNDYQYGLVNEDNENSWMIGVGVKWNIFDGFMTKNRLEEVSLQKKELNLKQITLEEGLAMQLKNSFLHMESKAKKYTILNEALEVAIENEELHARAYKAGMLETDEMISSQFYKAIIESNHLQQLHDFAQSKLVIEYIVGKSLER